MRADTARYSGSDWPGSATQNGPGARRYAVREHRPRRHRTQFLIMACRRAAARYPEGATASCRGREHSRVAHIDRGATLARFAGAGPDCGPGVLLEAGRDGFWLQRLLSAHGIAAYWSVSAKM